MVISDKPAAQYQQFDDGPKIEDEDEKP